MCKSQHVHSDANCLHIIICRRLLSSLSMPPSPPLRVPSSSCSENFSHQAADMVLEGQELLVNLLR